MHPSEYLRGTKSKLLEGRKIVVGISGSIAAVESVRLIRELVRHGADVIAVMSDDAMRFISPEAIQFACGRPPIVEITGQVEHVELFAPGKGRADMFLLAPATANTISKIVNGIADTPVTTCASVAIGNGVPMMVVPAMHGDMMKNQFIAANVGKLKSVGATIIPPILEEGEAKLPPPEIIAVHVVRRLARGPWAGRNIVILGGSTAERLDDVRALTNLGSGRTAIELAAQAYLRGANVTLWMGECKVPIPQFIGAKRFETLKDIEKIIEKEAETLKRASAVIVPAALADYMFEKPRSGKIDSAKEEKISLTLVKGPKILPRLRALAPPPALVVGFKLDSKLGSAEMLDRARKLLETVGLDAVVSNDSSSMGGTETKLLIVRSKREPKPIAGPKDAAAGALLDELGGDLK
jgi:phosphopantothenoylcysteine decarboxylase/phosphopantothenate--cysteine ligase